MASPRIAVTGATGVLGGMVAKELAEAGVPQLLLARNPAKAPQLPKATAAASSYSDAAASTRALAGIDTLFMVSAPEGPDRLQMHRTFIHAAQAAGVKHVVYTSFVNADKTSFTLGAEHAVTEADIAATGMAYTFLRYNFYIDFMPLLVGEDGAIRGPGGRGELAPVARRDVARAAAAVLRDPAPHAGRTYDMTGPEALSLAEIAAILSRHRGSPVSYVEETVEEAHASRASPDVPDWQREAWVSTYTCIARNELANVSGDVERITGRAPTSLEEFLAESK